MILPGLGFIGTSLYSISGKSRETGFELSIEDLKFRTKYYEEKDGASTRKEKIFEVLLDLLISISLAILYLPLIQTVAYAKGTFMVKFLTLAIGLVSLIMGAALLDVLLHFWLYKRETSEWHACEHKSAVLVKARIAITIQNLKKSPAVLIRCGTSLFVLLWEVFTLFWVYGYLVLTNKLSMNNPHIAILLISFCAALYVIYFEPRSELTYLLFVFLSIPVFVLPLLTEYLFVIRKPSEEKLRQTSEELQKFLRDNQL